MLCGTGARASHRPASNKNKCSERSQATLDNNVCSSVWMEFDAETTREPNKAQHQRGRSPLSSALFLGLKASAPNIESLAPRRESYKVPGRVTVRLFFCALSAAKAGDTRWSVQRSTTIPLGPPFLFSVYRCCSEVCLYGFSLSVLAKVSLSASEDSQMMEPRAG